jgi:hypothetical protein
MIDDVIETPAEIMRAIFHSSTCQCGAKKQIQPLRLLCGVCMSRLPRKLQNALREIELAEALIQFYDEALAILVKVAR